RRLQAADRRPNRQEARRSRHSRHPPYGRQVPRRYAHPQHAPAQGKKLSRPRIAKPPAAESRQLVILTGLSGSGKSTVLKAFEDMGYYCVDNLPIELMPIFAELHAAGEGGFTRAALLVDAREGVQLEKLPPLLKHLRRQHPIALVFIEAAEDALLRRYSETPRPH